MGVTLDARKDFLRLLSTECPSFHHEFVTYFLTDKLALNGIEADFFRALSKVKGILVLGSKRGNSITIELPNGELLEYETYEDVMRHLLTEIRENTKVLLENNPRFYATEIHAVGEDGIIRVYEGRPVHATSLQAAKDFLETFMPYARISSKETTISNLANKA